MHKMCLVWEKSHQIMDHSPAKEEQKQNGPKPCHLNGDDYDDAGPF